MDVSALDGLAYCRWLDEREAIPAEKQAVQFMNDGTFHVDLRSRGYRLPTESEWIRACRAGTMTSRYFGSGATPFSGSYIQGAGTRPTQPIALKMPNGVGLFDVLGNLSELTLDETRPRETIGVNPSAVRIVSEKMTLAHRGGWWS